MGGKILVMYGVGSIGCSSTYLFTFYESKKSKSCISQEKKGMAQDKGGVAQEKDGIAQGKGGHSTGKRKA